jgi:hypothetical protein
MIIKQITVAARILESWVRSTMLVRAFLYCAVRRGFATGRPPSKILLYVEEDEEVKKLPEKFSRKAKAHNGLQPIRSKSIIFLSLGFRGWSSIYNFGFRG